MSESFAALFEESLKRAEMRTGEVITAEVIRIDHSFVVVNAGLKSEAYVPLEEFKNDKGEIEVQVGDFVSVAIDSVENGYGDTILLSRDTAKRLASWMSLEKALESGEFVTGTTSGKVKGGLTVLVNGIRAFLPGSLVDTRPTKDLSPYENKTLEFKVIKLDRKRNNVVLSRRAVVEASMGEERAKLMEHPARRLRGDKAWSRTSPNTVRSWTWAASTACCTSPTWHGAVCVTHPKWWPLVKRSQPKCSSSTPRSTAFLWA
jgi:small subunit ribosomal protein S1